MCLITMLYDPSGDYPLILLANRDESYNRKAAPLHHWSNKPAVIAGRDLEAGGTWLGISPSGKLGVLTNHPFTSWKVSDPITRGNFIPDFLSSNLSARDYIEKIRKDRYKYDGFHLLCGDKNGLTLYSNTNDKIKTIKPGLSSISNTRDDLSYFRMVYSKELLNNYLEKSSTPNTKSLAEIMKDTTPNPKLINYPNELTYQEASNNSSIFISGENFGTVATTVLIINKKGRVELLEYRYNNQEEVTDITEKEFYLA